VFYRQSRPDRRVTQHFKRVLELMPYATEKTNVRATVIYEDMEDSVFACIRDTVRQTCANEFAATISLLDVHDPIGAFDSFD
jgi:hypothetical protein